MRITTTTFAVAVMACSVFWSGSYGSVVIYGKSVDADNNMHLATGAVQLAEQSPSCSDGADYVGFHEGASSPDNPVFVVMCKHAEQGLYYSKADIEAGSGNGKVAPVCEEKAVHLCIEGVRESLPQPDMLESCTEREIKTTRSGTVLIEQVCHIKNGRQKPCQLATMCAVSANGSVTIGFSMTAV